MKPYAFAVAALALVAAAPVLAVQDKKPDDAAKAEKRICRSIQVTGSMMGKRECHTAAEWKQQDEQNAANADQLRDQRSGNMRSN